MTLAVQVSVKKADGTIYVIGGSSVDEFDCNLVALGGGERQLADEVLEDMALCLSPMSAAAVVPPPDLSGFYTPQPPAGAGVARTSVQPVAVKIPWANKASADPFLTPLKASRQAQWDPNNKQWILQPGVDLTPFARWLPPGV